MTGSCKYSKVTQQHKFHLLTLVLQEGMLIKKAAKLIGINYSTAKTIIFFHRQHNKAYQFDFKYKTKYSSEQRCTATVEELVPSQPETGESITPKVNFIEIICTVGGNNEDECKDEEKLCPSYSNEKAKKPLLRNYPLTHQNRHAQQKGKTEDDLFQYRCITRSQNNPGTLISETRLGKGLQVQNLQVAPAQNH